MFRIPVLALSLLTLAAAPASTQGSGAEDQSVTVTGHRIQSLRDRLAACLARNCPVNEDADATLALAEALFLDGAYRGARETVQASLGRNSRRAGEYPEPVSDLYRAHSRLSRHLGFDHDGRRSAHGILRALREGIPQEDHRHFTARMEIAEILMRPDANRDPYANFRSARRELQDLARVARAAGREDVAIAAELRNLYYEDIIFPNAEPRRRLVHFSRLTAPEDRMRATGARILLASIYRREGQTARADALLAEISRPEPSGARRRLLYAPRVDLQVQGVGALLPIPDNFEDTWIDVGFWIMPDGQVSGLETLRDHNSTDWAAPLLRSIRGRRYSEGPDATYRLERYTYTTGYTRTTRTRLPVRAQTARIEYLDLTTPGLEPGPPPIVEN